MTLSTSCFLTYGKAQTLVRRRTHVLATKVAGALTVLFLALKLCTIEVRYRGRSDHWRGSSLHTFMEEYRRDRWRFPDIHPWAWREFIRGADSVFPHYDLAVADPAGRARFSICVSIGRSRRMKFRLRGLADVGSRDDSTDPCSRKILRWHPYRRLPGQATEVLLAERGERCCRRGGLLLEGNELSRAEVW